MTDRTRPPRKTVACPQCRKRAVYDETNPYRPFCSERCKLIDLGAWATESYAIPGEPAGPQAPESEDPEDT
jgi:endogenous inhibitor of DNA gyrase (YacG/DUF329 family)